MKQEQYAIIGKRIRELRVERKMSQVQLGEHLSVSQDTISLWEKSKSLPPVEMIIELSKLFGIHSDFLLGLSEY